jgi:hypothetical protein
MFERPVAAIALLALAVGGCAPAAAPSAAVQGEAPPVEGPSNFASPTDILHRYPTMRHQQL